MKKQIVLLFLGGVILFASCAAPNSRAYYNRVNKMSSLKRAR